MHSNVYSLAHRPPTHPNGVVVLSFLYILCQDDDDEDNGDGDDYYEFSDVEEQAVERRGVQ